MLIFKYDEVSVEEPATEATATEAAPLSGVKRNLAKSSEASQGREWRHGREEEAS
jgi:hypothetical protein